MSDYLELRQAKIARNEKKLAELGLVGASVSHISKSSASSYDNNLPPSNAAPVAPVAQRRSSRLHSSNAEPASPVAQRRSTRLPSPNAAPTAPVTQRRSSRLRSQKKDYQEAEDTDDDDELTATRKRKRKEQNDVASSIIKESKTPIFKIEAVAPSQPQAGFTHNTSIDIQSLLFGSKNIQKNDNDAATGGLLGRQMHVNGKAIVVNTAAAISSSDPSTTFSNGTRFNKYSGICEWDNDSMFLWVNMGSPKLEGVVNEFRNGGRQITWYGGRKSTKSPAIKNLLRISQEATKNNSTSKKKSDNHSNDDSESSKEGGIILWCRIFNKRGFSPYICLGRMGYASHDFEVEPIQFVWNLLDYDYLMKMEDDDVEIASTDEGVAMKEEEKKTTDKKETNNLFRRVVKYISSLTESD